MRSWQVPSWNLSQGAQGSMLTGSPDAFNEACSKSINLSSFLLHLGSLCPLPGSGHSLHGFVPRQFQPKRLQLAQLGIRLTDMPANWQGLPRPARPYLSPPSRAGGRNLAIGRGHIVWRPQSLPEKPRCLLPPVQWVGRDRELGQLRGSWQLLGLSEWK